MSLRSIFGRGERGAEPQLSPEDKKSVNLQKVAGMMKIWYANIPYSSWESSDGKHHDPDIVKRELAAKKEQIKFFEQIQSFGLTNRQDLHFAWITLAKLPEHDFSLFDRWFREGWQSVDKKGYDDDTKKNFMLDYGDLKDNSKDKAA